MKLPDESPAPIIDAFLQLHEGTTDHDIPMMPREAVRDDESLSVWPSTDMVGYMFKKDAGRDARNAICSDLDLWLKNLDDWGIAMGGIPLEADVSFEYLDRLSEHQDRIFCYIRGNPHEGMKSVRRVSDVIERYPFVRAVSITPFQLYPTIAPNSKEYYPLYSKCAELGVAVSINVGFPGPRTPAFAQDPIHLDEVCWYFPELTVVMRHGGEPWTDVCVKMLARWPNLYYTTTAFTPRRYPPGIIDFANSRGGSDKIIYAGYFPLISFDRAFPELGALELKDEVWQKLLNENARKAFGLDGIPGALARIGGEGARSGE